MSNFTRLHDELVARFALKTRPNLGAAMLGLMLCLMSLTSAFLVIGLLKVLLPSEALGPSAAASISELNAPALVITAVLIGPFLELFEGQVIPIELLRRIGASPRLCVLLSALCFGGGHYWNGGIAHGASTFAAGLVFAYGYVICRPFGWVPACLAAFTSHAAHNAVMVSLMLAFPRWAAAQ